MEASSVIRPNEHKRRSNGDFTPAKRRRFLEAQQFWEMKVRELGCSRLRDVEVQQSLRRLILPKTGETWNRDVGKVNQPLVTDRSTETEPLELRQALARNSLVAQVTSALNATVDADEMLNIVLVAATAGEGLGFHRAFLFLSVAANDTLCHLIPRELQGTIAIGPSGPAEAGRIWSELALSRDAGADRGLHEAVTTYRLRLDGFDREVNERIQKCHILTDGDNNLFFEILREKRPRVIHREELNNSSGAVVFDSLDVQEVAAAAIVSGEHRVGLILADFRFGDKPINATDLELLQLLSDQTGNALERSRLTDNLEEQIDRLQAANDQIAAVQERLRQVERLALVGEITSEVAHQLRNPLAIIGGFAAQMEKQSQELPRASRACEVIRLQVKRMESILDRVAGVGDWNDTQPEEVRIVELLRQILDLVGTRDKSAQFEASTNVVDENLSVRTFVAPLRFSLYHLLLLLAESVDGTAPIIWSMTPSESHVMLSFTVHNTDGGREAARQFRARWTAATGPQSVVRQQALGYLQRSGAFVELSAQKESPLTLSIELPVSGGFEHEEGLDR